MHAIEIRILTYLNSFVGQQAWFDSLAVSFTKLAPFIFMVLFGLCFFWPMKRQKEMRQTVILAGLSGVVSVGISLALTALLYRPRPFVALPPEQIHMILTHAADSSFPSNHTLGSAGLAAGMWRAPSRTVRWITAVTAGLVGISRIVVGVHWPSDVVLSIAMGIAIAWGVFAASPAVMPVVDGFLSIVSKVEATIWSSKRPATHDQ